MSRLGDPAKVKEAKDAFDAGMAAITTGFLKWKPDYLQAEPLFQKAARAYRAAGLFESAVEAWRKAVVCSQKMGNVKQAVITLETTAREMQVQPGVSSSGRTYKELASDALSEAGGIMIEEGDLARGADLKLRAGKLLEGINNDRAAKLYDEACNIFDGEEDKDVYAKEALSKALNHQLDLNKHASAMKTFDRLAKVYTRLNQPHNLYKLVLSRVILLLAAGDGVAAEMEYHKFLDVPGFPESTEAAACEDLIHAMGVDGSSEAVKAVTDRNVVNYLDPAVAKIAKKLSKLAATGDTHRVADESEKATRAVDHRPAKDGFQVMGGASAALGIGSGGFGAPAGPSGGAGKRDVERFADDRRALFSKPTAPAHGGAGDKVTAEASFSTGGYHATQAGGGDSFLPSVDDLAFLHGGYSGGAGGAEEATAAGSEGVGGDAWGGGGAMTAGDHDVGGGYDGVEVGAGGGGGLDEERHDYDAGLTAAAHEEMGAGEGVTAAPAPATADAVEDDLGIL